MNPTSPTKKPKIKPVHIVLAVVASFACVCLAIVSALSSDDPITAPEPQAVEVTEPPIILPTNTPLPTAILDPKAALKFEIEKILGESDRGVQTLLSFDDPEPGAITIKWAISDSLNIEWISDGARYDATQTLRALDESGMDYTYVILSGSFPLVDVYGNTNEGLVLVLTFNKSTVEQINWGNFQSGNIDNIADDAFIHRDFQD